MTKEDLKDHISDFIYDIKSFFVVSHEQICRFFYYGWKMRNAYEFDSHSILMADHYATTRLLKFMQSNSTHTLWTSYDSKLLRRLIEYQNLGERLLKYHYNDNTNKFFDSIGNPGFDELWGDNRKEWTKYESFCFKKAVERDTMEAKNDWKRYCKLRERYLQMWWD